MFAMTAPNSATPISTPRPMPDTAPSRASSVTGRRSVRPTTHRYTGTASTAVRRPRTSVSHGSPSTAATH